MSHFKYEIDERNLRLQLKASELSFSEEAWQKYEGFSATQKSDAHDENRKRFNFSLNRNVVLPIVFGSVIILFSLLLFNFINIKNPHTLREERAEAKKQAESPEVKEEKQAEPLQKAAAVPAAAKDSLTLSPVEVTPAMTGNMEQKPVVSAPVQQPVPVSVPSQASVNKPSVPAGSYSQTDFSSARRSKKYAPVITEAAAGEDEQAPPPIAEASAPTPNTEDQK